MFGVQVGAGNLQMAGRPNNAGADFQQSSTYGLLDSILVDHLGRPIPRVSRSPVGASGPIAIPIGGYADESWLASLRVDRLGNSRQALENIVFRDNIEGATQNSQIWTNTVTTQTVTQAATGITLNANSTLTTATGAMIVSQQMFSKIAFGPLHFRARLQITSYANGQTDFGFGIPATAISTGAIPNGAYFREKSNQTVVAVVNFNSVGETEIALTLNGPADNSSGAAGNLLVNGRFYVFDIIMSDDRADFQIQDATTGAIIAYATYRVPYTAAKFNAVTHIPVFFRNCNASATLTAQQTVIGDVVVSCKDWAINMPLAYHMPLLGQGGHMSPTAYTQTSTFANSAAPANATLSNTVAGYTTKDGLYSFAAVAGAATDYVLFGFTVPSPYTFMCTGVYATCWNTGAIVATTPSLLFWGLGHNGASANLSTGAHLRTAFGTHQLPVGAAIGANAPDINVSFETPIPTFAGKNFAVILRMPVGTATASQVIQGSVAVRGFFM